MIGHLQRNKVKRTLPLVDCIHSADSVRLLDTLEEEARNLGRSIRVLLEVNVSGDVEKLGFARTRSSRWRRGSTIGRMWRSAA